MIEVIVVGGGFAGLSAATSLAARGVRAVVFEARPALGGRATAYRDAATGDWVDNGQHVLLGCYHETFRFLSRIGADRLVAVDDALTVECIDRNGRRSRLACPRLPSPLHLLAGVLGWDGVPWRDRATVLRLAPALLRARRAPLDGPDRSEAHEGTVSDWLRRHGQGRRLIELLWEPLALAALNQPCERAAAAMFVHVLGRMFGPDRRDASLAVPRVPLPQLYAEPSRVYLERRGGVVRTSAPARIAIRDGRVSHVTVRGEPISADRVVCAVPWFAMADAFDGGGAALAPTLDAAARTAPSPIVTVNLWLDRAVLDRPFLGLPGRTFQWVFDKRLAFGDSARHLSLVSSGAEEPAGMTNDALIDRATAELRSALPAMRDAHVLRATAVRERRATFSLAPDQPLRPATRTSVAGLVLAGDWISTGLPATIESAVISGHAAADAIVRG